MTPEQAIALIEKNDLKAVCEAFGRADTQWHEKEWKEFIEAVRRDERERIRDTVNEDAKNSFYVGSEMWRNDTYRAFRKRIFDVVFAIPKVIQPCQFKCGNNIDWVVTDDDREYWQIAITIQCGVS